MAATRAESPLHETPLQGSNVICRLSWGVAPGWYECAPLALKNGLNLMAMGDAPVPTGMKTHDRPMKTATFLVEVNRQQGTKTQLDVMITLFLRVLHVLHGENLE